LVRKFSNICGRAAGTYVDIRTGPHHSFRIEGFTHPNSLNSKFKKSQKEIILVSFLPKNKQKLFFGRNENTLKMLNILHKS
jgi:hypothetical protein